MNARVITNARIATKIAPATSIHGCSAGLAGGFFFWKPATDGIEGRCGGDAGGGRSEGSCAVGVAARGGICAAMGGPQLDTPCGNTRFGFAPGTSDGTAGCCGEMTGAPGTGWPGSVDGGPIDCGPTIADFDTLALRDRSLIGSRETGCGRGVRRSRDWNRRVSSVGAKCWCGGVLPSIGVTG